MIELVVSLIGVGLVGLPEWESPSNSMWIQVCCTQGVFIPSFDLSLWRENRVLTGSSFWLVGLGGQWIKRAVFMLTWCSVPSERRLEAWTQKLCSQAGAYQVCPWAARWPCGQRQQLRTWHQRGDRVWQKAIAGLWPHGTLFHWAILAAGLRTDDRGWRMANGGQWWLFSRNSGKRWAPVWTRHVALEGVVVPIVGSSWKWSSQDLPMA